MAVFTDTGGIDMRRILAFSGGAIVTADTISDDVGMIESSRQPGVRAMTGFTLVTALRMTHRFAGPCDAVVTTAATADHLGMIDAADRTPGRLQMTILAQAGAQNMIGRHRRRFYESGACMTGTAFTWRSLKNAANVTSLTIRVPVRTL